MNKVTKIINIIRLAIIGIGVILFVVGLFPEGHILETEGYSMTSKIITIVPPLIFLLLVIIDEILVFRKVYKRHFISYVALWGLAITIGINPIANFTQLIFDAYPIQTASMFSFIIAFILVIVCDNRNVKENQVNTTKQV